MEHDLYTISLVTDIFGAFWLAKGIIWKSKRKIKLEATTFYNGNPYLRASQKQAFFFGWFGFAFLTIGFLGQIISQNIKINISNTFFLFYLIVILLFSLLFNKLVKFLSNKDIPKKVKEK